VPANPVQRRLAAILAADVAGYSRLMGEDEEGTLAALTAHRTELFEPCIAEHRGRVVKTTGDGLLVEFASVVDAVRCAVAFQEGMAVQNSDTPQDRRIEFRIGVNLGDVIVQDDDVFGDGVNVAARLEGLAEPGGVVVSGKVHEEVRTRIDIGFDNLGPQPVKNIAEPVNAFRIRFGAVTAATSDGQLPLPEKPSIAVLPRKTDRCADIGTRTRRAPCPRRKRAPCRGSHSYQRPADRYGERGPSVGGTLRREHIRHFRPAGRDRRQVRIRSASRVE
jgi:adenylate cyclase